VGVRLNRKTAIFSNIYNRDAMLHKGLPKYLCGFIEREKAVGRYWRIFQGWALAFLSFILFFQKSKRVFKNGQK
jgi:hypothetical protein